jgi:hypothetical protein
MPNYYEQSVAEIHIQFTCADFYLNPNTAANPGFDYHEVISSNLPTCKSIKTLVSTTHAGNCGESVMLPGLLPIELRQRFTQQLSTTRLGDQVLCQSAQH